MKTIIAAIIIAAAISANTVVDHFQAKMQAAQNSAATSNAAYNIK